MRGWQAYLLMRVDAPRADLAMPAGLLEAARATWLESCKKVCPSRQSKRWMVRHMRSTLLAHGKHCLQLYSQLLAA